MDLEKKIAKLVKDHGMESVLHFLLMHVEENCVDTTTFSLHCDLKRTLDNYQRRYEKD